MRESPDVPLRFGQATLAASEIGRLGIATVLESDELIASGLDSERESVDELLLGPSEPPLPLEGHELSFGGGQLMAGGHDRLLRPLELIPLDRRDASEVRKLVPAHLELAEFSSPVGARTDVDERPGLLPESAQRRRSSPSLRSLRSLSVADSSAEERLMTAARTSLAPRE